MVTEEKIREVRKQLRKGIPQGEIRNDLIKEGYSEEDLQLIFTPHRPDMRNWCLFFAALFLVIGIYRVIADGGILFLLFAAGMFAAYVFEVRRIKDLPS